MFHSVAGIDDEKRGAQRHFRRKGISDENEEENTCPFAFTWDPYEEEVSFISAYV
jgi:hypothetical protein